MSDGPIGAGGANVSPPDGTGRLPTASPKLFFATLPPNLAPIVIPTTTTATVVQKAIVAPADGDYWVMATVSFAADVGGVVATPNAYETCEVDLVLDGATVIESGLGTSVWIVTNPDPFTIRSFFDSVAVQGTVHLTAGAHTIAVQCSASLPLGIEVQFADLAIQPFVAIDPAPP